MIWAEPKSNLDVLQSVALKEGKKTLTDSLKNTLCPRELCKEVKALYVFKNIFSLILYQGPAGSNFCHELFSSYL